MLGAVNSVAGLFGTADLSTNIELVTVVKSGFGGVSLLPGAADSRAGEVQDTVIATTQAAASAASHLIGRQILALPARHCSHGMFQSPRPSSPGRIEPTVFAISTMSPRLVLS